MHIYTPDRYRLYAIRATRVRTNDRRYLRTMRISGSESEKIYKKVDWIARIAVKLHVPNDKVSRGGCVYSTRVPLNSPVIV